MARVEKRVRGVLHLVYKYRHTGVSRDDMAANNQRAQKAKELMGELEQGYLEGTTRSSNAPSLPQTRLNTLGAYLTKSEKKTGSSNQVNAELESKLDSVLAKAEAETEA